MGRNKQARIGSYIRQEGPGVFNDQHSARVVFCHLGAGSLQRPNSVQWGYTVYFLYTGAIIRSLERILLSVDLSRDR